MISNGYDGVLFDEINEYNGQVQNLNKEDPLYHQRMYTLAGVEYTPEESGKQIDQSVQKKIISKVVKDAIRNTIFFSIAAIIIALIMNGLGWRLFGFILHSYSNQYYKICNY